MADTLVVIRADATIQSVNQATCYLLGYTKEELIDKPVRTIIAEEVFKGAHLEQLLEEESVKDYLLSYRTKRGERIPMSFSGSAMRDSEGKLVGIVGVAKDMRAMNRLMQKEKDLAVEAKQRAKDLKKANVDLKETQDQLLQAQKMESIGKLAGGIAHDFNNLLGGILGQTELLSKRIKDSPELVKKTTTIMKASQRAQELTQQLLGFARKGNYEMVKMDLNAIIEETRTFLYRTVDKSVNIRCDLAPELWAVEGDASQISQILMNLGLNARDAMPTGGDLWYETQNLSADKRFCKSHEDLVPGDYVRISVRDSGTGIAKEIKDSIFEPFTTTKEVGKGTGLGLAMVYGIVKNHNGVVTVYSEDGKGAEFHLYFPAAENHQRARDIITGDDPDSLALQLMPLKSILVVDDEDFMREIACDILEDQDSTIEVLLANNGEEALALYKEHQERIEVIILDLIMPKMDGIRAFNQIRKINPRVPVIFASGYSESDEVRALSRGGHVEFIQKPFLEADLIEKINQVRKNGA